MSQKILIENSLAFVINPHNEAILVAFDVEDGEILNGLSVSANRSDFFQVFLACLSDYGIPSFNSLLYIRFSSASMSKTVITMRIFVKQNSPESNPEEF